MSEWNHNFQFSNHLYAPTVSSDGRSSAPTDISRHTYNRGRFPRYDNKSVRSASTYLSSLKSGAPYKHRYYEAVESIPSTASIPPILPSTTLNPPKVIKKQWHQKPIVWIKILSIFLLILFFILSIVYRN
eukprot:972651_1